MVLTWLIVGIAAVVLELITPTALVSIWFAVGSVVAMLLAFFQAALEIQIVCFVFVSVVAMLIVRPVATHYLRGNTVATNADRCIGQICILTKAISETKWGEIVWNGVAWSAVSVNNESIEEGTKVKVIAIEGAKLIVKRI